MGLDIETLQAGDGKTFPQKGQTVTMHFNAMLANGNKFETSRNEQPRKFKLGLGEVIRVWDETLAQMSVGQRVKVTCTHDYAYGTKGRYPLVPPSATLMYDLELLEVE
ncbi:peptidyl-prolyl cis-trans isomerase FKBP1A-like [Genypterus blacodes]|uniref:peptidyl-prolyl cis-trans isomerase FKBP1A-like n=1 Tax=Genypterus blacodes TaxID=154954 RepID=UPI003F77738B